MLVAVFILTIINTLIVIAAVGSISLKVDETKQRIDQIWDDYVDEVIDFILDEGDDTQ